MQKTMVGKGQNSAAETSFISKKVFSDAGNMGLYVKENIPMILPETAFTKKSANDVLDQMEHRLGKMLEYLLTKSNWDLSIDTCKIELLLYESDGACVTCSFALDPSKKRINTGNVAEISKDLRDGIEKEIMKTILKYNPQFNRDAKIEKCELTLAKVH